MDIYDDGILYKFFPLRKPAQILYSLIDQIEEGSN
jgi:hypothetical protein